MNNRIKIAQTTPEAVKPLFTLSQYLQDCPVTTTHKELIKIRASQINHCAYCLNMHTRDARKYGETEQRIYLLNAWREVHGLYTEEEQAILALTEEITEISKGGVSDATYQTAAALFAPGYLSQIIMAIVTINAWNRIAISTQMQPD